MRSFSEFEPVRKNKPDIRWRQATLAVPQMDDQWLFSDEVVISSQEEEGEEERPSIIPETSVVLSVSPIPSYAGSDPSYIGSSPPRDDDEEDDEQADRQLDDAAKEARALQIYEQTHPDHEQKLTGGREITNDEAFWHVSTFRADWGVEKLRDNNPLTYWQ